MKLAQRLKKYLNPRPIDNYVSEIDQFLAQFDATHAENHSVLTEKLKHKRIAYFRDNVVKIDINSVIWQDF